VSLRRCHPGGARLREQLTRREPGRARRPEPALTSFHYMEQRPARSLHLLAAPSRARTERPSRSAFGQALRDWHDQGKRVRLCASRLDRSDRPECQHLPCGVRCTSTRHVRPGPREHRTASPNLNGGRYIVAVIWSRRPLLSSFRWHRPFCPRQCGTLKEAYGFTNKSLFQRNAIAATYPPHRPGITEIGESRSS